jgi:hypothetical protein
MPANNRDTPRVRLLGRAQSDLDEAQRGLALLTNWRAGSTAAAIVMAILLPFAIAWRVSYLIAIAASIILAATLAISCHLARQGQLLRLAVSPNLAQLPAFAATRRRLQSARTRRALAGGLRRTASPIQPSRRFDPCPVLADRAAAMAGQLLELADALEQTRTPDPASVALIRELLTDGTSPLYNPNLPATDLETTLTRARAGITALPTA